MKKEYPGYKNKSIRPIHVIVFEDGIWQERKLWIDFEDGSANPLDPLTKCIKFSLVKYNKDKEIDRSVFKMTNPEELIKFINILKFNAKDWVQALQEEL